ncbi:MAG: hypothetical protein GTO03_13385, partial [Planctomycetales bacterium]|nr:hypothetical protein [Planctomycetales bacterium]
AAQAQQAGPGYGPPASSPPTAQQTSALLPSQPPMGSGGPATAGAGGAAAAHPPLGLDGTCPVELVDNERWIAGDRRWGAIHRGRLYLFTSQAHQQKFLANPDYYSPAISGHDPVLAVDQRQLVAGKRQHGLFYDKRVFLFANEQTLARFYQDPLRYAEGIRQVGPAAGK